MEYSHGQFEGRAWSDRVRAAGSGKALANMAKKELERGLWKKDQKYLVSSVATQDDLHRTKALFA